MNRELIMIEKLLLKNGRVGAFQLGFVVKDIINSAKIFSQLFGIHSWDIREYNSDTVDRMVYKQKDVDHSFLTANGEVKGLLIELIQPLSGPNTFTDFIDKYGVGIHHLGVDCSSTKEALRLASKRGLSVLQEGYGLGPNHDGHYAYIDTRKELGIILEYREIPSARWPSKNTFVYSDETQN